LEKIGKHPYIFILIVPKHFGDIIIVIEFMEIFDWKSIFKSSLPMTQRRSGKTWCVPPAGKEAGKGSSWTTKAGRCYIVSFFISSA
jgi:hypothetical protein